MASTLSEWTTKAVTVLTCDGRLITGTLQGYDQLQNLILKQSHEKVYSAESPMERVELGLFVVRGDNVAVIADCGDDKDDDGGGEEDDDVRAEPIKSIAGNR
eukprot:CAMPEP_0181096834 /NCGR_PEP_ID=MMETSP1071-20121207/11243_1 /TAXON_ID=35127 /ORGANISM="Thalassiosira sp., Strain NH16" /LENGTH=101 /DNA_ID=CAMNT_0023179267 /DNA_START=26 /DNA_END=331 /DNA_ORIENTATION=-